MGLKYRAQYRVTRHNGRSYYLDFALPESDIAIECDGAAYHSSPAQKRRDLKRQREIENLGWQVVRFTGSQIVTDLGGCEQVLVNLLKRLA
jgi:very-short-patch-repair endonuclease